MWKMPWIQEVKRKRAPAWRVCRVDPDSKKRVYEGTFWDRGFAEERRVAIELWMNGRTPYPEGLPKRPSRMVRPMDEREWMVGVEGWIKVMSARPSTKDWYRSVLGAFGKRSGVTTVGEVSDVVIQRVLVDLARERSPATVSATLRALIAFFRWARAERSPVTVAIMKTWHPYRKHRRARPHLYTPAEYQAIIEACDWIGRDRKLWRGRRSSLWWKTFITLLYHTGLRMMEAGHLIWQDVDLGAGLVRVKPHTDAIPGVVLWQPKGRQRRLLPLSASLTDYLTQLKAQQSANIPYVFLEQDRYIDVLKKRRKALITGINKGFKVLRRRAGVQEGTIHDWRRTAITNWCRFKELKAADVQLLAGHNNISTTFDFYSMVTEEEAAEKAGRMLNPPSPPAAAEPPPQ